MPHILVVLIEMNVLLLGVTQKQKAIVLLLDLSQH